MHPSQTNYFAWNWVLALRNLEFALTREFNHHCFLLKQCFFAGVSAAYPVKNPLVELIF
jgi:hypothetical protein